MLLYHFTTIRYLSPNLTPGEVIVADLPPLSRGDDLLGLLAYGGPLVWLTTDRDSELRGDGFCARITIKLQRGDRRLQRWMPYMRQGIFTNRADPSHVLHGADIVERGIAETAQRVGIAADEVRRRVGRWFFYRGEIPPARFEAIDILDGRPWWQVE